MRISILLSIALIFIALPENLRAQEHYEFIYADSTNKQDSIIDFGATIKGNPVFRTIVLKNLSKDTAWLGTDKLGFYFLGNDPAYPGTFREFGPHRYDRDIIKDVFPMIVPPMDSFKFLIAYDPQEENPLGKKTAFLTLNLRKYPQDEKGEEVAGRRFFLTVEKTNNYLVTSRDTVRFDSVYVGKTAFGNWTVINASTFPVSAEQFFSSPTGEFKEVDILKTAEPGPGKFIPVELSYTPINRGADTATIQALYLTQQGTLPDTISSVITGFGAEQQLDLISAKVEFTPQQIIDDSRTPDAGDTIDLGDVFVGTSRSLTLDFKNEGNISFKALKDSIILTGLADTLKSRTFSTTAFEISQTRTAEITLTPRQMGRIVAEYVIESDIASRVKGAPPFALKRSVFILMKGVEAVVSTVQQLPFDTLEILGVCRRTDSKDIVITNTGNIPLTIQSAYIQSGTDFALAQPFNNPVDVAPGAQYSFKISFTPGSVGFKNDQLVIKANSAQPETKIALQGEAIPQQTISLSLPQDIRVRPGTIVRIPVTANGNLLKRATNYTSILQYDSTLLKPHFPDFVITQGTASAGAFVEFDPDTDSLKLRSPFGFSENDTLVFLQFDTFLGNSLIAEVINNGPLFSTADCPDVSLFKTGALQNGRIMLDSACGLNFKVGGGSGLFRFQSAYPAPSRDRAEVEYEVAFKTAVNITLYDSYGRIVQRPVEAEQAPGTYHMTMPTAHLTPGVYFCEMRAGIYHAVQQIIVAE